MEHERDSVSSKAAGNAESNNLTGDKVPLNLSPERIGALLNKDYAAAKKRLQNRGFDEHFIWHFVKQGQTPSRSTIKNHLGKYGIKSDSLTPEIMYLHLRWIFFYLIHLMRGLRLIHRENRDFAQALGVQIAQIPKHLKDNRENHFLQGYLVGRASKYIDDPDEIVSAIVLKNSRMAAHAGRGKKGVITSPASKAIFLAFDYGHLTGKKVRQFFDGNPILDEISVDIEFIDDSEERMYRFCGLDESKDTVLTTAAVNSRVSQLKIKYKKRD